jgi:hypothetical protein
MVDRSESWEETGHAARRRERKANGQEQIETDRRPVFADCQEINREQLQGLRALFCFGDSVIGQRFDHAVDRA